MTQPIQTALSTDFYINGKKRLAPENWQDIEENIAFGQFSNQPIIATERFTFIGNAAEDLREWFDDGKVLKGLGTSFQVRQRDKIVDLFEGKQIDLTDSEFIAPKFDNDELKPLKVIASVRHKKGVTNLQNKLDGISWSFLDSIGKVSGSDYTTVKTAVQKIYNALDIAIAIISLYMVFVQLRNLIEQAKKDISEFVDKIAGSTNPGAKISGIIYVAVILALRLATAVVLIATLVATIINIITLLIPPIVKNKGITLRRGLEIIFDHLGFGFVSDIAELDTYVFFPSKVLELSSNFVKNLIPTFEPNEKGYPSPGDFGYLAIDFLNECRKLTNSRIDIVDNNVVMRWENDPALFTKSGFVPREDINTISSRPNTPDIPNTRILTFAKDLSDEYTSQFYKGTAYEVINDVVDKVDGISLKGVERIDFAWALGTSKTSFTGLEKIVLEVAKTADTLGELLGKNPKLEKRIKKNRINVLRVSTNNHAVAKIIPIVGNSMPKDHRKLLSAKYIENTFYINRSIIRGNGQKKIVDNFETVFNLEDRQKVIENGNFITLDGRNATFVDLKYRQALDFAEGKIQYDFNYIAKGTVNEILIEPLD